MEISPRRAEARRNFVFAFSPMLRAVPVRCDVMSQTRWSVMPAGLSDFLLCSSVVADHREAVDDCWFLLSGFPS